MQTLQNVRQTALDAKVIRADGTVEDLGTVSYWHRNPVKRALWSITQRIRGRKPGRISVKE